MSRSPDFEDLEARLAARGGALGRIAHVLDEVTSTNDLAKAAAHAGAPHGSLWIAERQTQGRGRQGRAWHSPPGEGLWLTVLLRLACEPARLPPLSLVTGLAARDAVATATREAPKVKWPNDVLLGGRKVSGCLVEAQLAGARVEALLVGVGINVHVREFPEELASRATSVTLHAREGTTPDRVAILFALLEGLERDIPLAVLGGLAPFAARLFDADALRGQRVRESGTEASSGIAEGIDDDGRLLVRRQNGELVRLVAGEVHLASSML